MSDYEAIIESAGGKFLGLQSGPEGFLVLFTDPESRSTLAVPEDVFSADRIARRIRESRRQFAAGLNFLKFGS